MKDLYEINHIRTAEMKSNEESLQLSTQVMQLPQKPEKKFRTSTGFQPVTSRCSNQLSYEATVVESWSIMCSYVSVKEMNVKDIYEINHKNCGNEIK